GCSTPRHLINRTKNRPSIEWMASYSPPITQKQELICKIFKRMLFSHITSAFPVDFGHGSQ
ncbi:MAG: hypothetical protein ACRBCK_12570, partial [Alphaproteobacteria bacterium]